MKKLLAAFVAIGFTTVGFGSIAHAATPPDSCFDFSAGTITDYYSNEGNTIVNPACPKDVDIPSTIAGQPVTGIGVSAFGGIQLTSATIPSSVTNIGNGAFQANQLTSVSISSGVASIGNYSFAGNQLTTITIPSSVTSIGSSAFERNQLTSVTFMNGLTSIGNWAFIYNRLTSVTIPNTVTSIGRPPFAMQSQWGSDLNSGNNGAPELWSGDPSEVQDAYDSIWYVRLYTADPSNPNGLVNKILDEDWWTGADGNANSLNDSLGGHILNPASAVLEYVNSSNANIQMSQTFTGLLGGNYLHDYLTTRGPIIPTPANSANPTPLEQQAMDDALSAYYRLGDEVTITPPAIDGYNTPPTQTFVLGAADNQYSYVYAAQSSSAASGGTLANTGMSEWSVVVGSALLLTAGAYPLIRRFE